MPSKIKDKKASAPAAKLKAKTKPVVPPTKLQERAASSSDESEEDLEGLEEEEELASGSEEEEDEWQDVSDDEGDSEEEDDVDEDGMERLMKALGEDGLDEFAQEQLRVLEEGDEDDEVEDAEDEDEDEEVEAVSGEEEDGEEEGSEEDEEEEEEEAEANEGSSSKDVPIPVDELSDEEMVDEDAMPRQKVEIDNKIAMERIRATIALDPSLPWTETLTVTYPETIDVDVEDDLNRELSFYKQALHSAQTARSLAQKASFPFTRPADYFAEMVKSDSHMERIRQRLLDESAGMKRAEDKRKEREGKKFGKQVQLEKIKERQQSKKEVEERLKGLKRKRKGALDGGADDGEDFDVAVEDAIADRPSKRAKGPGANGKSKLPRVARDKKFGFGGAGRRSKQNTKDSTDSFVQRGGPGGRGKSGGSGQGGRGGKGGKGAPPKRPGKNRRMAQRSRS